MNINVLKDLLRKRIICWSLIKIKCLYIIMIYIKMILLIILNVYEENKKIVFFLYIKNINVCNNCFIVCYD